MGWVFMGMDDEHMVIRGSLRLYSSIPGGCVHGVGNVSRVDVGGCATRGTIQKPLLRSHSVCPSRIVKHTVLVRACEY